MRRTCRWIHIPTQFPWRRRIPSLSYHTNTNLISIDFVRYLHNRTGQISISARATTLPGAEFSQYISNAEMFSAVNIPLHAWLLVNSASAQQLAVSFTSSWSGLSWLCCAKLKIWQEENKNFTLTAHVHFIVATFWKVKPVVQSHDDSSIDVCSPLFMWRLKIMFSILPWKCKHVRPPPSLPLPFSKMLNYDFISSLHPRWRFYEHRMSRRMLSDFYPEWVFMNRLRFNYGTRPSQPAESRWQLRRRASHVTIEKKFFIGATAS